MISLVLTHRLHGTKRYYLHASHLNRLPQGLDEEQQARMLARLFKLAPAIELGWEFEIRHLEEEVAA